MIFTFLSVFFFFALSIIFLEDWVPVVAKLFRKPLFKLCVPLLFVTAVVAYYQHWILWFLGMIWGGYINFIDFCVTKTPFFKFKMVVYQAIVITFISLMPTVFAKMTEKPFRPFRPPYWGSILIWIGVCTFISLLEGAV